MSNMTSKGQVTIPKRLRDAAGIKPGRPVDFKLNAERQVVVIPARKPGKSDMAKRIAKVRGSLKTTMSTDEIMEFLRGD